MKKIISILAMLAILLVTLFGFSGCVNNDDEKESRRSTKNVTKNITDDEESEKEDDDEKSEKENKTEKETNNKKSENETKNENNVDNNSSKQIVNLGEKYVDLDKRSFAVNGKVYTLGVNTLQEMIDDGVPFDEDDIANANNNLNKNSQSSSFEIVLGKYYFAQVRVTNESNENMKVADCKISQIYFPVNQDKEQNILSFAFPLTITEEELLNNAGEPTDKSEYKGSNDYVSRTYKYTVDSTKYYGKSGYTFEFTNGKLRYVTISYMP